MFDRLRSFNTMTEHEFDLTNQSIDLISNEIQTYCSLLNMPKKDMKKTRLTAEECLLQWQDALGEEVTVIVKYGNRFARPRLIFSAASEKSLDPFSKEERDANRFSSNMLANLGLFPEYTYQDGCNTLTFRLKKKETSQLVLLAAAVGFSVLFGIVGRLMIPSATLSMMTEGFLSPLCDKFFDVLRCISGPMIFLSVAWGLYGIGDANTLSRIGKKMILKYISVVFLITVIAAPLFMVLGPGLSAGSTAEHIELGSVFKMLLDVFPANIFSPFIDGNTLQIIFLAMIIGIVLLFLEKKTSAVAVAIEQINYMVQFMVGLISKLVPFFIFVVLVQMIWSDAYMVITDLWRFAAVALPAFILNSFIILTVVAIKYKAGIVNLFQKSLPTLLVALSTASSAASFSTMMECCSKRFGINDSISSFGVPLGFVMFKPTTALYYLLISFYFAGFYHLSCNIGWIIIAVFLSVIISMATPPIPGGSAAAYTMLFLQLGIPAEALTITLGVDILFDFFMTAGDMFVIPLCLLDFSSGIGKLNLNILRQKNS